MKYRLLLTLLFLSSIAFTQQLPAWSKGERAAISKRYFQARDLYLGTGELSSLSPEKREKIGQKLNDWVSDNSALINRQPIVLNLLKAYLIPNGYRGGTPRQVCLALTRAQSSWDEIDHAAKGRDLVIYLKQYFEIDENTVPVLLDSWYPKLDQNIECFNNGCDENPPPPPPADWDKDGVPDLEDDCPNTPGKVVFSGCPDTDDDGFPDNKDRCPMVPGPQDNFGCPKKVIETPAGGLLEIGLEGASYERDGKHYEDVSSYNLVVQLIGDGEFNTKNLELDFVSGTELANDFHGSEYLLLKLTLLDSLRHQVIQFPTGEFQIHQTEHYELWEAFDRSINDFTKSLRILRTDFGMYRKGDFLILSQGKADSLSLTGRDFPDQFDHALITQFPVFEFTSPNSFTQEIYQLGSLTYSNDDLPFLRGAWLTYQLYYNPAFNNYKNQMRVMKGKVVNRINEKERNGTLYIAIHLKRLKEELAKLQLNEQPVTKD